jgi:hypothetical protein|nr:MAG TPA: hypothetical protein [Caudoviricetes sp.]
MSAACFCAAIALSVAARFSVEPTRGVLLLVSFFLIGLGWAIFAFIDAD